MDPGHVGSLAAPVVKGLEELGGHHVYLDLGHGATVTAKGPDIVGFDKAHHTGTGPPRLTAARRSS